MLELYSGTGSVGKVARGLGWRVFSVDNNPDFSPSHLGDILVWDYTTLDTPDIIWASPPCTTFTAMQNFQPDNLVRAYDGTALTDSARMGDALLDKALEIIEHFKQLNPNLVYFIENPSNGLMKRMPQLQHLYQNNTTYCKFEHYFCKPTVFFSNFKLDLPKRCSRKHYKTCQDLEKLEKYTAYVIPPLLIHYIFAQCTHNSARVSQLGTDWRCCCSWPPSSSRSTAARNS